MVRVDHYPPSPIPKCSPPIRQKHILRHELSGPHFLISPEYIALRMRSLRQQTVRQPHRLHCLAVIYCSHPPAGLPLEFAEDRFCVNLVLSAVSHHLVLPLGNGFPNPKSAGKPYRNQTHRNPAPENPKLSSNFAPSKFVLRPVWVFPLISPSQTVLRW